MEDKFNYKSFISGFFTSLIILLGLVNLIKTPYAVMAGGGIIPASDRVVIDNQHQSRGSFNLAYVGMKEGSLFNVIKASLTKSEIIVPMDKASQKENSQDVLKRNTLDLINSEMTAIKVAYPKAGHKVIDNGVDNYIYVVNDDVEGLHVGDKILSINNMPLDNAEELRKGYKDNKLGTLYDVKIIDNKGNEKIVKIPLKEDNNKERYLGFTIASIPKLKVDPKINFKFKTSENGSSGGLAMALTIYNHLTPDDITKGKKVVVTGVLNDKGEVGDIGGVLQKLEGARDAKADIFIVPAGFNEKEVLDACRNKKCPKIIGVKTFDETLEKLRKEGK